MNIFSNKQKADYIQTLQKGIGSIVIVCLNDKAGRSLITAAALFMIPSHKI